MNDIYINTAQNVSIQYNIASLGDRIVAHIIDFALMIVYIIAMSLLIGLLVAGTRDSTSITAIITLYTLAVLPIVFYHLLFELFNNGQSPGKRALNIKVVKMDGTPLTIGALLIRWIFRIIDTLIFSGAVATIVIAVNGRGQRIGDIVAGTTVVKTRGPVRDNIFRFTTDESDNYVPRFPQVTVLTEKQILMIRQVITQARTSFNTTLFEKTAEIITDITHIEKPAELTNQKFVETVIKDYYYYQNHV